MPTSRPPPSSLKQFGKSCDIRLIDFKKKSKMVRSFHTMPKKIVKLDMTSLPRMMRPLAKHLSKMVVETLLKAMKKMKRKKLR
jgi:hypothetical protein